MQEKNVITIDSKFILVLTNHSINSHVQKPSWANNGKYSINEFKDSNHHFIFIFWGRPIKKNCEEKF